MIAKTRFIAYIVAATDAMAATAADYVWTGAVGDGDWTNPLNFTLDGSAPDAIPGADDKVSIPADTTVTLYYDRSIETKKASCEAFAAVGWISPADDSSVIDITVPENATLTLACAIATRASTTPANLKGTVVKRGRGTVALASNALLTSGSTCFDYATTLDVAGGVLRLPATANDRYCAVRKICVRSGATLEVQSDMSVFDRLDSEAESSITNIVPETRWFVMREGSNGAVAGEVSGMTSFDVHSGRLSLVGGNNTFDGDVILVRGNDGTISPDAPGTLSVLKFGVKADGNGVKSASSIGHAETVLIETQGGGLRYLGSGETTDKTIALKSSRDDFGFIDAGPQGGIEFAGDITMRRESTIDFSMKRLVLTGSNAAPATISGTIAAPMTSQFGKTNYTFRITKRGTGVWKMLHNDSSDMRGVFAVNEGTLAFDTLAEKGVNSALGKSTILQEDVAGVKVNPGTYGVDYAFLLGGGGRGSLEYVGSTNCASSTRLSRLTAKGRSSTTAADSYAWPTSTPLGGRDPRRWSLEAPMRSKTWQMTSATATALHFRWSRKGKVRGESERISRSPGRLSSSPVA